LLVPTILAIVLAHPAILVVVAIAFIARRWLPDPIDYVRHARRISNLESQIAINPANAAAKTQLAEIWLAKRRPRRAIPLLEYALERDPSSAEHKYLLGLAYQRAGQAEAALKPLSEALAKDDRVRYGSAYLAIADALSDLRRDDEAIEAYERYLKINTSSLEGYTKLVRAHRRKKDEPAALKTREQGLDTFRVLPGFQRRKQLLWWLQLKLAG
jgi:tetratricopeptide (TPR) repeat protein